MIKFLVGIYPHGFITFLSDCYDSRALDKYITKDSGFYNLLERGNEVIADRGFQIKEELLLHFWSLEVPPGGTYLFKKRRRQIKCLINK